MRVRYFCDTLLRESIAYESILAYIELYKEIRFARKRCTNEYGFVCMYLCTSMCIYVHLYACMYVHVMYVPLFVCIYVYSIYVRLYVCRYVLIYTNVCTYSMYVYVCA